MCDNQSDNELKENLSDSTANNNTEENELTFPIEDAKYWAFELKGESNE